MTMMNDIEMKCGACGKTSSQPVLLSTNTFGYADLDMRPPEMRRSTMNTWVMECPHCGYVSANLENEAGINDEFLKTDKYQTCDGFDFKGRLAGRFYRAHLIANELNDTEASFFNLLYCAWNCDDAKDSENACRIRKLALPYLDEMIESENERKNDWIVVKADLLRRTRQFDRLVSEYEGITTGEEMYDKIITFQIRKANLGDDGCYTVEDVVNE